MLLGIPGFHICDLTRLTAHPGQAEEQAGKRGVLGHRAVNKNPVADVYQLAFVYNKPPKLIYKTNVNSHSHN